MRLTTSTLIAPLILAACGGSVPSGTADATPPGAPDAQIDGTPGAPDASAPDAAPPRCDVTKPFGAPTAVPRLNHETAAVRDVSATLTPDERTVVFQSNRPDNEGLDSDPNLWTATRDGRDDVFGEPTEVEGLINTATGGEYQPFVTADRLGIYYMDDPQAGRAGDVYLSTRNSTSVAFGMGGKVAGLGTDPQGADTDDGSPFLAGNQLYFSTNKVGARSYDIYRVTRDNTGTFGELREVAELNTPTSDLAAVLSADGRDVYWASTRTDGNARGDYDIWHAHRDDPNGVFTGLENVAALNTGGVDIPSWLSTDGCVLYLESGGNIMIAVRPR